MSYRSRGKKRTGGNAKQATNKKVKTGMSIEEALHALNPDYMDAEVAGKIQVGYNDAKPFKYAYLHDFVDAKLLQAVQDELLGDEWVERVNDLYSFAQTDDMKNTKKVSRHLICILEISTPIKGYVACLERMLETPFLACSHY